MNTPLKPFFYFEKLKAWEWIIISFYFFITIWLYSLYIHHPENRSDILFFYPVASQLFIIFFLYTSLRNLSSYIIWFLFGLFHLYVYTITKNDVYPNVAGGHPSEMFKYTIILLLFFQVLRLTSRKIQLREFVIPSKGSTDLFDNIKPSSADIVIFIINMAFWFTLTITSFN
jgi:hypothetical protein